MLSSRLKLKAAEVLREIQQSLIYTNNYKEFPQLLEFFVNTLFPVDWIGVYTFGSPQSTYNVVTNPGLPFDWNEKYMEVMPYDELKVRSLSQPVGGICLFSPEDYQAVSDSAAYCYETIKKYTDTSQFLALHTAKTDVADSGIGFYRTDENFKFDNDAYEILSYLSPFLVSMSHTMMLHSELDLKRTAFETVCKVKKSLYLCLDRDLNVLDLPRATESFLKQHFKHQAWNMIPERILNWLRGVAASRGPVVAGTGPWATHFDLPDMELFVQAHVLVTEERKTVLVLLLRPHGNKQDFSILAKDGLSPKELEALSYLPLGYSNRQIGLAMNINEVTVKKHLKNASGKLAASGRTETLFNALRRKFYFEEMID